MQTFKSFLIETKLANVNKLIAPFKAESLKSTEKLETLVIKTNEDRSTVKAKLESNLTKNKIAFTQSSQGGSTGSTEFVYKDRKFRIIYKPAKSAGADAQSTARQELGSAWIMRRAINDNQKYSSWEDIKKDPKYPELLKIYPELGDEWLKGYFAQQARMLQEFGDTKFSEYNRDGGFMDFISNLVKKKFGISKKDTWNPADIWLIKDAKKVEKRISDALKGDKGTQNIAELNAILRQMYKDRDLVGISLKKISGKIARYEEVNLEYSSLGSDLTYETGDMKIDLGHNGKKFNTQDSIFNVNGEGVSYKFQMKGNDSSKLSNLKWEPTQKGATSARIGKAPVDMVKALMKSNNLVFNNKNNEYPLNGDQFLSDIKKYTGMYNRIKSKVATGIKNDKEFIDSIVNGFKTHPHTATSKLMQLDFFDKILSLNNKKRDALMTDMVFMAAKKGEQFGPFGKLY